VVPPGRAGPDRRYSQSFSSQSPAAEPAGAELCRLSSQAAKKNGWPALRRHAASAKRGERRGLAYFVLGYREYEAGEYSRAVEDLRQAASTRFSLSDFAEYYQASAAVEITRYSQVVEVLEGFSGRHPQSTFRLDALGMLARALLQTDQADRAIQVLAAEPRVRQRSSLALLLAQAYAQAQKLGEAARAFQEVYYAFPTAAEAKPAGEALRQLQSQLGASFPVPSDEVLTARVNALFNKSRFAEAEQEYAALLQANPTSPLAGRWKVGRGRCLLHLKRAREAVELLASTIASDPEADGERLAALVDTHIQEGDAAAIMPVLEQLRALYPRSQSYAAALLSAGAFFTRQGDADSALRCYQFLAEQFPQTDQGREANWWVAWASYLRRQDGQARQAFLDHLTRYPTSAHVPAALYWLGRLEEERGATRTARALYWLLTRRFAHSYYALQASQRVQAWASERSPQEASKPPAPDPAPLEVVQRIPPPQPPPLQPCVAAPASESLQPFEMLKALSLSDLARQFLTDALAERPDSSELRLALSRWERDEGRISVAAANARQLVPNSFEYGFSALPKEVWELLYPKAYWSLVQRQARANRLDSYLVMGLIRQESLFNPGATSSADARGLMQILPKTASRSRRRRGSIGRKLYDPAYNVRLGCAYLRDVLKTFDGNLAQALAAYNAGDARVKEWLSRREFREPAEFVETIPLRETRFYVQTVLRDAEVYRQLLSGSAKFMKCR